MVLRRELVLSMVMAHQDPGCQCDPVPRSLGSDGWDGQAGGGMAAILAKVATMSTARVPGGRDAESSTSDAVDQPAGMCSGRERRAFGSAFASSLDRPRSCSLGDDAAAIGWPSARLG